MLRYDTGDIDIVQINLSRLKFMFGNAAASDAASLDMVQSLPTVIDSKGFTIGLGGDMKDENCARKQLYNFKTACLGEVYSGSLFLEQEERFTILTATNVALATI